MIYNLYTCIHTYIRVCVYINVVVCVFVSVYMCVCIYIYLYILMYFSIFHRLIFFGGYGYAAQGPHRGTYEYDELSSFGVSELARVKTLPWLMFALLCNMLDCCHRGTVQDEAGIITFTSLTWKRPHGVSPSPR